MFCRNKYFLTGLCWLSLSAALLTTRAEAALLYSNGGLNPKQTSESGVAAPAGASWSECQHDTANLLESNTNSGFSAAATAFHLADDFTVPAGMTWNVGAIDFYAFQSGAPATPSPFVSYNVQIWNGRPGDPGATVIAGDLTTNRLRSSTDTLIFRIFNSKVPPPGSPPGTTRRVWRNRVAFVPDLKLPAGTYWVEWQSSVSNGGGHFYPPVTIEGARTMAGWNARGFTVSTSTWADVIDAGFPATAPDVALDFPFDLNTLVCGDKVTEDGEACDDGNQVNGDGCDNNCTRSVCGNGIKGGTEQCDDGNQINGDGCDNTCTLTACGNGILTTGEICDDGNKVNGDGCDTNCTVSACGNGAKGGIEKCDDGNTIDGDGCDSDCTVTACGNGILTKGEACDDGNTVSGDGCDSNCRPTGCGNGAVSGSEACDDGNNLDGDGCDNDCTRSACGNRIIAGAEKCDDGNTIDGDGCDSNCQPTACGNGVQTLNEQCDDGNNVDGDGCSAKCEQEMFSGSGVGCTINHGRSELGIGVLWMMLASLMALRLRRRERQIS